VMAGRAGLAGANARVSTRAGGAAEVPKSKPS